MTKADLRAEMRVPVTHRGTLGIPPDTWFPCLIQDISSTGFQIMTTSNVAVGDVLELRCELYPESLLQCKIEVRHITEMCLGTKVVEMSNTGLMLCRRFIEEHVSLKRFG